MQVQSAHELAKEGQDLYQKGDFTAAAQVFQAASQAYHSSNQVLLAAEVANNCSVAWMQAGQPEQALAAVEGTAEVFAEAGDIKRQAMSVGNQAFALDALHRTEEAMPLYLQAEALFKQVGEDDLRAYVMQAISKIQFRTGRQFEALASMQAGINGIEKPNLRQKFLKRLLDLPMRWLGSK